jgi:protein-S-isoprenylcysteine O-methyltransferase Ste14
MYLALGLGAAGLVLDAAALAAFVRARTTVNPLRPEKSSALVRSGAYRLSRNPMYLGLALLLAGWAIWLANALALALLPAFVAWLDRFQIRPEERALAARFGAEYEAYRARVRRWL